MGILAATVLAGAATGILLGVRRHAPRAGSPWYWWSAALGLAALSRLHAFSLLDQQRLTLAATVLVTAGLWDCARRRQPDPERGVLFDALALTVAVGAVAWAVADPLAGHAGVPEAVRHVAASRLLVLLAVIAVAVRLLTADAPGSTALRLFTAGLWVLVLGQMASIATVLAGGRPFGWGWVGGGLLWALAALHPSMLTVTVAGRGPSQRGYRNIAVAVAVLVMPILALRMVTTGDMPPGAVLLAAGVLPVILLARLLHGLEAREQAIRQSRQLVDDLEVSEQRYRSLFEFSPDAVFSMDLDGRITSVNPVAVAMFGTSAAPGGRARDVVSTAAMATALERFRATVLGVPQHFETALMGAEGRTIDVEVTMLPIVVSGELSGVYGILHDITDRKQAEAALRERDALARSVLESLPGESAVLDGAGRIMAVNRAWTQRDGVGEGDVLPIGTDYVERWRERSDLGSADVDTVVAGLDEVLRGQNAAFSHDYAVSGGRWVNLRAAALHPSGGAVVAHFDITERRAVEEQLRRAQKMEAIGHLAGGIAHDFNNLLAAISGYTELLQATLDPDGPTQACVAEIGRAVDRAASLVGQLMVFSRQAHVDPLPVDVNTVVREIEGIVSRLIGEHIEIRVQLDGQAGPVLAEAGSLEQVLLNLAVNARDAMPGGGQLSISTQAVELHGPPGHEVGAWMPGPYVRLEVSDTGCGMSPEVIERVFEPFFSTKREAEGTGLGLPTVYGIVSRAGGHLDVHSVLEVGTTFTIHLPVTAQRPALAVATGDPVTLAERSERSERRRVLLVEDQSQLRLLMATALEQHGYEVWVATDGADALEVAEAAGHLDLVVTDVVMPHMGGPALADRLFLTRPNLRVLYMSGYTAEQTTTSDFRSSFLQKPFSLHEFTAAADRLVADGYPGQVVVEGVGQVTAAGDR